MVGARAARCWRVRQKGKAAEGYGQWWGRGARQRCGVAQDHPQVMRVGKAWEKEVACVVHVRMPFHSTAGEEEGVRKG